MYIQIAEILISNVVAPNTDKELRSTHRLSVNDFFFQLQRDQTTCPGGSEITLINLHCFNWNSVWMQVI